MFDYSQTIWFSDHFFDSHSLQLTILSNYNQLNMEKERRKKIKKKGRKGCCCWFLGHLRYRIYLSISPAGPSLAITYCRLCYFSSAAIEQPFKALPVDRLHHPLCPRDHRRRCPHRHHHPLLFLLRLLFDRLLVNLRLDYYSRAHQSCSLVSLLVFRLLI